MPGSTGMGGHTGQQAEDPDTATSSVPRLGSYFLTVKGLEASQPASATQLESVIEQDSEVREAFHKELQNLL